MDPTGPGDRPPLPQRPAPRSPPSPPDWGASQERPAWLPPGPAPPPSPPGWGQPPAPPSRRRRRPGRLVALVAALVAVALAVVALRPAPPAEPSAQRARSQRPAASAPADPRAEVPRLLARRARAILAGDRAAFLATVDRRRTGYYRSQATLFARMRTVPFSAFSYQVTDRRDWASTAVRRRYTPERVYLPRVEARYRFEGQDASPVLARFSYTFVLTRSGWRIGGEDRAWPGGRDDVEIWDAGPVETLRTGHTLVVHHPGDEPLAGRLLRAAERAYDQVGATWKARWERKVVILVPSSQDEAERLVGARDLSRVAAIASSSVESGPTERVLGNRIVVNTANVSGYTPLNLQVLVTHEMTHVATRTLGDGVPLLLVEGFADYTALKPLGLSLAASRPNLAAHARAGRFDGALPDDRDFRTRLAAVAYDEGSAFCQWVAETFGEDKLRALYQAFTGPDPPTGAELDRGFRRVLGDSRRAVEPRWAAWVRERL
jgi:hypothetical protein